eukprot:405665-Lingulodinium_polyedra.AAC.1
MQYCCRCMGHVFLVGRPVWKQCGSAGILLGDVTVMEAELLAAVEAIRAVFSLVMYRGIVHDEFHVII